jgi:excisionase family DNA binding protein
MTDSKDLLTTKEVAEILRVTERTVQRWCKEGKISSIELPGGRGYRIPKSEIDKILEG